MLNRLSAAPITCPVSNADLMTFVACLDPSQETLIESLGLAATEAIETYLDDFIVQRSIRWVMARGENEKTDEYFRSWLSSRSYISNGWNAVAGQWINFPTSAQSVQSVTVGVWGEDDIDLVENENFVVDLMTDPARMTVSYNLAVQDFFTNFDHLVVDYTGGIAPSGSTPNAILLAIKILTKKMFENRDTENTTFIDSGVNFLICNYRRNGFGYSR